MTKKRYSFSLDPDVIEKLNTTRGLQGSLSAHVEQAILYYLRSPEVVKFEKIRERISEVAKDIVLEAESKPDIRHLMNLNSEIGTVVTKLLSKSESGEEAVTADTMSQLRYLLSTREGINAIRDAYNSHLAKAEVSPHSGDE